MLDSYELKQGSFEIVDSQMVEIRSKRILYFRLLRFLLISLGVTSVTLVSLMIITLALTLKELKRILTFKGNSQKRVFILWIMHSLRKLMQMAHELWGDS